MIRQLRFKVSEMRLSEAIYTKKYINLLPMKRTERKMIRLQAHRGVAAEYPENTMAAFYASVEQGYHLIELDPKYTADGKFVFLHDKSLNRTARNTDGSELDNEVLISEITLDEATVYDYGAFMGEKFKGEKLPTLEDVLDFAEQNPNVPLKIDNVWERFPEELKENFLSIIAERGDRVRVCFTCKKIEDLELIAKRFPNSELHYDGPDLSEETLSKAREIAGDRSLVIWVCFENKQTVWCKNEKASVELCNRVKKYGQLGLWILSEREELEDAVNKYGADVIETTGHIKPWWL